MKRPDPSDHDRQQARLSRLAAVIIAGTMVLWMGAQGLGGVFGWPDRFVFLFDLAALAGFLWALAVTIRIWRARRNS
jgi:hypothetical protein